MDSLELKMQKKQTQAYIDADRSMITIYRTVTTPNARGGVDKAEELLFPQEARILVIAVGATETISGTETRINSIVVFKHDADVEPNDEFIHDDFRYRIVFVDKTKPYQIKAEAVWASN